MSRTLSEARAAAGGDVWRQRRAEIVRTAAQLFDRQGYAQTSVDQIAQAASLQKASLYHYVDSKADLLVQIHTDFMELLFEKLHDIQASGASSEAQLRAVILHIVSLMSTHRAYVRSLFEHFREAPAPERTRIAELRRKYEDAVSEMVAEGMRSGEFRSVDPYFATMTIFGAANWAYQWFGRYGSDPTMASDVMAAILFEGLRADRRTPAST